MEVSLSLANQLQHLTSKVVGGRLNRFVIAAIRPIEGGGSRCNLHHSMLA